MEHVWQTQRDIMNYARLATCHNYGQTVLGIHRLGDNLWLVRMSSWPRAKEAVKVLNANGYIAYQTNNASVVVSKEK